MEDLVNIIILLYENYKVTKFIANTKEQYSIIMWKKEFNKYGLDLLKSKKVITEMEIDSIVTIDDIGCISEYSIDNIQKYPMKEVFIDNQPTLEPYYKEILGNLRYEWTGRDSNPRPLHSNK